MTHLRVKSSNIFSLAHEGTVLEARFVCVSCGGSAKVGSDPCARCDGKGHGATYSYLGVDGAVYESIIKANSVGQEFNAQIKGKYKFTKGE